MVILGAQVVDETLASHLGGPHAGNGARLQQLQRQRLQPARLQDVVYDLQGTVLTRD